MITLPPAAGPLYQAATAPGGDAVACLLLADLHEEAGDPVGAAGWRWLGRNPESVHGDSPSEDPFDIAAFVLVGLLPAVVRYHLPRSIIDAEPHEPSPDTNRITPGLWLDRQTFIEDFLTAWRAAHAEPTEDFHLQSD